MYTPNDVSKSLLKHCYMWLVTIWLTYRERLKYISNVELRSYFEWFERIFLLIFNFYRKNDVICIIIVRKTSQCQMKNSAVVFWYFFSYKVDDNVNIWYLSSHKNIFTWDLLFVHPSHVTWLDFNRIERLTI
jgi:hypothetical protein